MSTDGDKRRDQDQAERQWFERKMRRYGTARGWPADLGKWNDDQIREARHAVQHGLDLPSTEGL